MLYNVFAKLTNDGGTTATGFRVELETGIGANFRRPPTPMALTW